MQGAKHLSPKQACACVVAEQSRRREREREIEEPRISNHERLYGGCEEGSAAAAGTLSVPPGSQERPQLVGTQRNLLCRGKNTHMRHSEARKEQESIKWVFSDPVMWGFILDFPTHFGQLRMCVCVRFEVLSPNLLLL